MTQINADRGGPLDGWPGNLGLSDHNGSGARAVPVEALERAAVHLLLRRKFVIPGNSFPITANNGVIHWYAPVQPFTTNMMVRGCYVTGGNAQPRFTLEVNGVSLIDSNVGESLTGDPASVIWFSIPFAVGAGVFADKTQLRIRLLWRAITPVTMYSTQLAGVPLDAINL